MAPCGDAARTLDVFPLILFSLVCAGMIILGLRDLKQAKKKG